MNKVTIKTIKGNKYYTTSVTKEGKTKIIYAKTKKELKEKYEAYTKKLEERASYNLSKDLKLKTAIEEYKEYKSTRIKATSLLNIGLALDKLYKYFGDINLSDIDTLMLNKFFNSLETSAGSKKTTRLYLNSFFKFYRLNRNIAYNPVEALELPKKEEKEELQWTLELDEEVLEAIRKDKKYKLPLLILYTTGIRIGELLGITPQDIDLKAKTISINKTLARWKDSDGTINQELTSTKNKYSNRIVYINDEIVDLLKPYLKYRKGGRIFTMTVSTMNNAIKRIKPGLHNHSLRHFAACRWYNSGISLKAIKKILGHSPNSTVTLNIYAKLNDSTVEEEIRKFI